MKNIYFLRSLVISIQKTAHYSLKDSPEMVLAIVLHNQVVVTKCFPCNQIPLSLALLKLCLGAVYLNGV